MVHLKKFIIVFVVAAFRSRPQFFIIFHSAFTEQKIESVANLINILRS